MRTVPALRTLALAAALLLASAPGVAGAQAAQGDTDTGPLSPEEETALLRRASSLEWQGDLDAAEEVLTGVLRRAPTSSGALFSLERVLRSRNRVGAVLPWADRFLEAAPTASAPRYMKLRVLVEVDSLQALDAAARSWFEAEPGAPEPYREAARLYERALGPQAALELLNEGRWALKRDEVLAVEAGDLRASMGDLRGAVSEWATALGAPDADVADVVRRVERLDSAQALAEPVLEMLSRRGAPTEQRLAGVGLAVRLGLESRAREVAEEGLDAVPDAERVGYLREVARLADADAAPALSLWALSTLREVGDGAQADLRGEARLAAAALAAGDTTAALAAQLRVVRELPTGSVERRRTMGDLIRVESRWSGAAAGTLLTRFEAFRGEYPDAPELDALAAATAAGLMARGGDEEALALLESAPGPRSLQARAWLHFSRGEVDEGREALAAALPGLDPREGTGVIQLLSALERLSPPSGALLAEAVALARHSGPGAGQAALEAALGQAPRPDRAPVRFHAARMALAAGDTTASLGHLSALVEESPDAPEVPEAIVARARLEASRPGGREAARRLLTDLILERPDAAVVPDARRELQRLGGPGGIP